ncbi:peptidylprolyl isomerase [Geobacter sp. DSM 9736]|uniref:peptidylprolyl isomerase n=1 Tax=Geobacter sp. DSM 9736 TaxID=1277350 RepID=UPI000B5FBD10|nr:peptidylprolyl isomerase [Geobacter sp. DSM 9736]SNB47312.1 peptidyl-prolyl cis-trans isomerase C [Geobacter sp. DSM 9736]
MHKKQFMKHIFVALSLMAIAGCGPKTPTADKKEGKSSGKTLAEVNGTIITTEDFNNELDTLPPYLKPMTETAEGKKELIETMVIRELILQQAKKEGVDSSPQVAEKLEELKKRLVVEAYLKKKVEEQAQVSDADMQKFYNENKEKFRSGEQVRASHILVKTEKEAQDILAQLKSGANFDELAKKHSMDAANTKGGDLGWFSKGAMLPEFEKAAFGLKEGETSGVVKTKYGYHIIKVTGKRPAGIRSYDEVKEQLQAALLPTKQQEVFQKLKEDLKKSSKYTIKEDALKELGGAGESSPSPSPKGAQPPAPSGK